MEGDHPVLAGLTNKIEAIAKVKAQSEVHAEKFMVSHNLVNTFTLETANLPK